MISELQDFSSLPQLCELIAEYMKTLPFDISYQSPQEELEDLSTLYSNAAGGAMLIAMEGNALAGCVAVKKLNAVDCEMKRLYVRPEFRGKNLGRLLADAIVVKAKELGYRNMFLDTHREAQTVAIAMYKKMGFEECEDYHPNPGKLLCLKLDLTART